MRFALLAAACLAAPLAAQTPAPPARPEAARSAPADPARLAVATRLAGRILPPGSYAKLMDGVMGEVMDKMMANMAGMDMGVVADGMGDEVPAEAKAELRGIKMGEIMAARDPHWAERQRIQMRVMTDAMKPIMTRLEPALRTGLASAYAKRFSLEQLAEFDRFFATPAGAVFAENSLSIWVDPDVMSSSMAMMPELMKEMPAIMKRMEAATAHLPPPRTVGDGEADEGQKPAA